MRAIAIAQSWRVIEDGEMDKPIQRQSTAEPVEDFARMEGPSADRSQQDRLQSRVPHGPLALAVMVVIACVSVAWGLTTLDCPTGKDQWGACKPRDPSVRTESLDFLRRLLHR
jgi:hypothetical protein